MHAVSARPCCDSIEHAADRSYPYPYQHSWESITSSAKVVGLAPYGSTGIRGRIKINLNDADRAFAVEFLLTSPIVLGKLVLVVPWWGGQITQ